MGGGANMTWVTGQLPIDCLLLDALKITKLGFPFNRHLVYTNIKPKSIFEGTKRCVGFLLNPAAMAAALNLRQHHVPLAKPCKRVVMHFVLKWSKSRLTLMPFSTLSELKRTCSTLKS